MADSTSTGHICSVCSGQIVIEDNTFYCETCGIQYSKLTYHTSPEKVICPIRRKNLQEHSS